jgi:hypothetical protein
MHHSVCGYACLLVSVAIAAACRRAAWWKLDASIIAVMLVSCWCLPLSAAACCCCLQVRSLVEAADPLALTEHGQFHRQPEACKVHGLLAASSSLPAAAVRFRWLRHPQRVCHAALLSLLAR